MRREMVNLFLIDLWFKLAILMLVFLGLTSGSYFYARTLMEPRNDLLNAEKALFNQRDIQAIKEEISGTNKTIEDVYNLESGFFLFSPALENFTFLFSDEIYLKNLAVSKTGKKMAISGFAKDRETFLAFKKDLEDSQQFSAIFSPISNLLKPRDVNFSMDLTLK